MSSTGTSSRFIVTHDESGARLDKYLAQKADITRSQLKQLIDDGLVLVNGSATKPNYKVRDQDSVEVTVPEAGTEELVPEDIPLSILYSDEHIIVVDKPAGLVVYPAVGHSRGTLMNALAHCFEKLCPVGAPLRPGVVHRLDKDTSGVMVVARSEKAYYSLVEQFAEKSTTRRYVALVYGNPKEDEGEVLASIGAARYRTERRCPREQDKASMRIRCGVCLSVSARRHWLRRVLPRAAPIRYGYIWRLWDIRSWGIRRMAERPCCT